MAPQPFWLGWENERWLQRLGWHLILAGVIVFLWILPDHFYRWFNPSYKAEFEIRTVAGFYSLAVLLLAIKSNIAALSALFFFALLQIGQLLHFTYFSTYLSPFEIGMLVSNFQENITEILVSLWELGRYVVMPMTLTGVAVLVSVILILHTHLYRVQAVMAFPALLATLAFLPLVAGFSKGTSGSQRFYPSPISYSIKNTYFALSYFLGKDLPNRLRGVEDAGGYKFLPYRISKRPEISPRNVLVIMGESLSYSHMGLFGYSRDTTPLLNKLKGDPDFVYRPAIAGGVTTKVSLPTFFNVLREPGNIAHLVRANANLFRMAKSQGLATYFISAQNSNLATYVDGGSVDHFIARENMSALVAQHHDEALLLELQKIDLSHSSFIVLHQRNSHFPYDENYPPRFERYPIKDLDIAQYMVNTYDNSVLFTDELLARIIGYLKLKSPLPVYLYFTSDHAEMLGENGHYGHNTLDWPVSQVPFIFYTIRGDSDLRAAAREADNPTHYEIGKFIAAALGYAINNPNESGGVYYINGNDISGAAGFLTVQRSDATTARAAGSAAQP